MFQSKHKLALAMIVKPDDIEANLLYRALTTEALSNYVDKIFITITCKEDDPRAEKVRKTAEAIRAHISYFEWIDDFAAARNFNFSQVPQEYDFIMWIDADDIVKGVKYLKNAISNLEEGVDGIATPYLYDFAEYGAQQFECVVRHNKVRIVRNNGTYRWEALLLHEDLTPQRQTTSFLCKDIQIMHLTNQKRVEGNIKRNLQISLKGITQFKENPRAYWNYANALFMDGQDESAIKQFFEFIKRSGSDEEVFHAWNRISQIYSEKGDYPRAIEAGLECLRIKPWYPDGYFTLARSFFLTKEYTHAKEMLIMGLGKNPPEMTSIVWNPRDYDFNPLSLLAKTYLNLTEFDKALTVLQKIKKMFPHHIPTAELAEQMTIEVEKLRRIDKIYDKALKCKSREKIKKLIDSSPIELQAHPKLSHLRNIHFHKEESSGKDLTIYCFETSEIWNPQSIKKTGIGGSEEAVVNLSNELAKFGWNVTVYNNCGDREEKFGDVWYRPFWKFNPNDKMDICIAWRSPIIFNYEINAAKKYVWLHDTISANEFTEKRLKNIDKIFVLSKFHRKLYPNIPDNKFVLTGNGINLDQFDNWICPNCKNKPSIKKSEYQCDACGYHNLDENVFTITKRDPYKLIYTSAPDRGLEVLLKMFSKIKERVPQATLALYYGWNTWDAVYQSDPVAQEWKKKILELMKQPGIVGGYERLSHDKIAREYASSAIWAYPSMFPEISCITAMKAQAAGAIPVTTDQSAVSETVQFGIKMRQKNIYEDEGEQRQYVNLIVNLLKNQGQQQEIRTEMIPWAKQQYPWSRIAAQWDKLFL